MFWAADRSCDSSFFLFIYLFACLRKVVHKDPTSLNLAKEFGTNIEFIYLSPPWKTRQHGFGVEGFFTTDHLVKLKS